MDFTRAQACKGSLRRVTGQGGKNTGISTGSEGENGKDKMKPD
jgi:hypothetical protein